MGFTIILDGDDGLAAPAMGNWRHVNYLNDLIPVNASGVGITDTLDLGNSSFAWKDLYISNDIIGSVGDMNIIPNAGNSVILDSHWGFDSTVLTGLTDADTTITAFSGRSVTIEGVTHDGGAMGGITTLSTTSNAKLNFRRIFTFTVPTITNSSGTQTFDFDVPDPGVNIAIYVIWSGQHGGPIRTSSNLWHCSVNTNGTALHSSAINIVSAIGTDAANIVLSIAAEGATAGRVRFTLTNTDGVEDSSDNTLEFIFTVSSGTISKV